MFHLQDSVNDWTQAIERLPDNSIVKAVDRGDLLRTVKQINPNIKTALRHWYDHNQIFGGDMETNRQRARQFFSTWIDGTFREQYAPHVDFVLEFNEWLASSHTGAELDDRLRWAEAVAWVWANEYRTQSDYQHIRLALLSVPVGNDIDVRFAEIALEYDAILSYHAYDHYIDGERDPGSWRWHCGRWHFMEQEWPADVRPEWMFGEAGPYESVTGGWRDDKVLGGDIDALIESRRRFVREVKQTPAYAEGRVHGATDFTVARLGGVFDLYRLGQPEMNRLAEMWAEEWTAADPPPPPESEEPMDVTGIDVSHWQGQMDWQQAADAGAQFAFVKATDGAEWVDPRLAENVAGAQAAGIPIGLYHYYRPAVHPVVQAHLFRRHWRKYDTELPPVLDLEETDGIGDAFISVREDVHYILLLIEWLTGRRPIIYTSAGWWDSHVRRAWYARYYDLWVANWTDAEEPLLPGSWEDWTFWQHSSDGDGAAYGAESDRIDLNRYNGTVDELLARYGQAEQEPATGTLNRDFNLRRWPELSTASLMMTADAGTPVTVVQEIEGDEFEGSTMWYELEVVAHSAGVDLDEEQTGFHFQVWPTDERRVTQRFGANPDYYQQFGLPGHEGLDLAAPMGSPIRAVYPGHVYLATGDEGNYGIQVRIDHGDGYRTVYAHLQELLCAVGDVVDAGDVIGLADSTGNSTGSHLHLTVKHEGNGEPGYGGDIIDPSPFAEEHEPEWP